MSSIVHAAIVITSWKKEVLQDAWHKAALLFGNRAGHIGAVQTNGYASFLIAPSGSQAGYPETEADAKLRASFRAWLRAQGYGDGSSPLSWVEVHYGHEPDGTDVVEIADSEAG